MKNLLISTALAAAMVVTPVLATEESTKSQAREDFYAQSQPSTQEPMQLTTEELDSVRGGQLPICIDLPIVGSVCIPPS